MRGRLWLLVVALSLVWWVGTVAAQSKLRKTKDPANPEILLEEFELDERNVVIAATKTKKTLQETPQIITVITAREIREQGHRTVNDVLRTVPGFHGDMWELNGWQKESFSRGTTRGLLVLLNGINILDPNRNNMTLDYKFPVETIKRIEVISGPGGVLWGSNALVGIVNIITKDAEDIKNWVEVTFGGGDGPALRHSYKGSVQFGHTWLNKKLKVYTGLSFFTTLGPELRVPEQKMLGVLPSPSNEGLTIYLPQGLRTLNHRRSWWLTWNGKVTYGPVSVEWLVPFEREYREIAAGGSMVTANYLKFPEIGRYSSSGPYKDLTNMGNDRTWVFAAKYKDRFWKNKIGVNVTAYYVNFSLRDNPFGSFAYSPILPGGVYSLFSQKFGDRIGGTFDMDIYLPYNNHLIFGGEFFADRIRGTDTTAFEPQRYENDPLNPTLSAADCPAPYEYRPNVDPYRPCNVTQPLIFDSTRLIGALFITNEWKPIEQLALNLGGRVQLSDQYSAKFLWSGAFVWNIWQKLYFKFNYAQGFRPPSWQSIRVNSNAVNGVTFKANPNLNVESSQAIEVALNGIFFENSGVVRRWFVRANYSYTLLSNLITRPTVGGFVNNGDRRIHSVEFLSRLQFKGGHEFWIGYYYVDVMDQDTGPVRNIANHILNAGVKINIYRRYLELNILAHLRGAMEDFNKVSYTGTSTPIIPTDLEQQVLASDVTVDKIKAVLLLRVGLRVKNIWKNHLEFGAYVYNVLDRTYYDPDFDFDQRVFSRPYPKPTIGFLVNGTFRY